METIGERAVKAIEERAKQNGRKKGPEAKTIGISRSNLWDWEKKHVDPAAYFLQQMVLDGYDIYWILTGKTEGEIRGEKEIRY